MRNTQSMVLRHYDYYDISARGERNFYLNSINRIKHKNMNLHKRSQPTNNQLFTKMVRSMKQRILPSQLVNQKSLKGATNNAND